MGWLDRQFRRQPYPDMTYREALETAQVIAWNIASEDSRDVAETLRETVLRMGVDHAQFAGRSMQSVAELNELWRGKVTTLLKWFQTQGAAK